MCCDLALDASLARFFSRWSAIGLQVIRDFAKSRAKALKDITARLPVRQRAGVPRFQKERDALPSLNYTRRGFRLGRIWPGGIVVRPVWSRELPKAPSSVRVYRDAVGHWWGSLAVAVDSEHLPATGRALGIDWVVRRTAHHHWRRPRA
jgi:putative transposase